MALSDTQLRQLRAKLDARHVKTRKANGTDLHYVEGWHVISEANRIFGFDGWSRETVDSRCVLARENRGSFITVYIAKVRITVQANGSIIIREGHGTGEGRGSSPGGISRASGRCCRSGSRQQNRSPVHWSVAAWASRSARSKFRGSFSDNIGCRQCQR